MKQLDLLHKYSLEENVIQVCAVKHDVSFSHNGNGHVDFYAVNRRTHDVTAHVMLKTETLEQAQHGLSVAFIYSKVLDALEDQIKRGRVHGGVYL
jgi:hypothetical protein